MSTKKKRLGSRRLVTHQNEMPKVDEFHVMSNTSVPHGQIPQENNESLGVLSNPDSSPDLTLNRRKLGSRRKNKVHHVKDSETYHKPREEVEKTRREGALETRHTSLSTQFEMQEELTQGSEYDMSETQYSSSYSSSTPGYFCEVQDPSTTVCPEDVLEMFIPKSGNSQADQEENETDSEVMSCKLVGNMVEAADISDTLLGEDVEENVHLVGSSDMTGLNVLSYPTADQQLVDQSNSREMQEEHLSVYSAAQNESKESNEETDLLSHAQNLDGNYFLDESHAEPVMIGFSTAAEIIADNSCQQNTKLECKKQETFSLAMAGIPADENQNEHMSFPLDSQPQDNSGNVEEQTKTDLNAIGNRRKMGSRRKNKGQQHAKNSVAESYLKPTGDIVGESGDNELLETTKTTVQELSMDTMLDGKDIFQPSQTEELVHYIPELTSISEHSSATVDQPMSDQSDVRLMPDEELPIVYSVSDIESGSQIKKDMASEITTDKSSLGQHTEPEFSVEQEKDSSAKNGLFTIEEQSENFNLSEVKRAPHTEDVDIKVHREEEIKLTEQQESHFTDYSCETVIPDVTENPEICFENLTDQDVASDTHPPYVAVKSTDDSAAGQDVLNHDDKQDEHSVTESNVEASDQINEDYRVNDPKKPQTSDTEEVDSAPKQTDEHEGRVGDDTKPTVEQTSHQEKEGLSSEVEESKTSLQTLISETNTPLDAQPQDNLVKMDGQIDTDFNPIGNRRKMGSSRRNKGRQHVKNSVAESPHKPTGDVVAERRDNEHQDIFQHSQAEELSHVNTTEFTSISEHSNTAVNQQVIEQSNVKVMPDEELPSVYSVPDTGSKERDEATDLFKEWGILQANSLVSESPIKSDDKESPVASEISTDKSSLGQHTEPELSVEQEKDSSVKDGWFTIEEQSENFTLSEVKGAQHPEDADIKVCGEEEVKPTEIQEPLLSDYSCESVIPDVTENPEICFENLTDRDVVSDTYPSDVVVKSIDDSAAEQDVLNHDKQDEHSVTESNVEASDQKDYHVNDPKKPQSSDTKEVDPAPKQTDEHEGRVGDDTKPTVEQASHQKKEGHSSEVEESKSSLQTLISETNTPLDAQPQDNSVKMDEQIDTNFNLIGNRRKLGSSHRNKGRQHVKNSVAESPHEPTGDVVGQSGDNEPLETTKISSIMETTVQELLSKDTMPEGKDIFQSIQTGEVVHVNTPELTSISEHSCPTVDQQMVDQSNARDMIDEEFTTVIDTESKERDDETDLLEKRGLLQSNNLVSESSSKSEGTEFSITPEITTEKNSHRGNVEPEFSAERATVSSQKEELSTNEEQDMHFSSEVRETQHLENAVHEVHKEKEDKSTERQEIHQTDHTSLLDYQTMDSSQHISEEPDSSTNPKGNRRKLGSSRRLKRRQHVPDSVTQLHAELKKEVVEDTILSQNIMDSSTAVVTDVASRSDKDDFLKSSEEVNEEEKKHIKEPENLTSLSGYGTVTVDPIQSVEALVWKDDSDTQNMSYHDDNVNTTTNYMKQTVGDIMIKDYGIEGERSVDVQAPGQVEVREECEIPAYEDHISQEENISNEVPHAELFSAAQNITDTWAPFDTSYGENVRSVDVSEESGISTAVDTFNSQQNIEENPPVDNSENSQEKFNQKRRKMGSTRRSQLRRKQEGDMDDTDETKERDPDRMEAVEEFTADVSQKQNTQPPLTTVYEEQQEINETSSVHDKGQKQQSSTPDVQAIKSNTMPDLGDSMALLPEESASHNEEVINPVTFVHEAGVKDSEGNVDVDPPQDDFARTEMQTSSVVTVRNRHSVNQLLPPDSEDAKNPDSEGIHVIQHHVLKSTEAPGVAVADLEDIQSVVREGAGEEHEDTQASIQELDNMNEELHITSLEMKNARRRKMGSTRKNLGSRSRGEDSHQKQGVGNEETAANVRDALTESVAGVEEKGLHHNEYKESDSEPRTEIVFETVESHHIDESQLKPLALETIEENPDSLRPVEEPEHQLTPDHIPAIPSTSPKQDVLSETAVGGRRRKMGSHRKSRGHQTNEDKTTSKDRIIDAQKGRDVRHLTDESIPETNEERIEESVGLDKISEIDKSDKNPSSVISISQATEDPRPTSEKATKQVASVQYPNVEIRLDQASQKKFSFADSRGADFKSPRYNVLMIGESSVGKTSFIKRAQSGKFSLEVPASIGLDSCLWTVVVDGKPVVLNLWDTAGQERFHSITKQVFHKAQAFLLMYDITSSQSFSTVSYWANCIQEGAPENVTILLLGNKCDDAKRQVKTQDGENLAKESDFEFMECSAATGENVIQALETVARLLSQKLDIREEDMVLHKEPPQKKRSGCC